MYDCNNVFLQNQISQTVFMLTWFKKVIAYKPQIIHGFFFSVDKCKIMDSKKRPLWLEWTNADPKGPNILIMYKNGDGNLSFLCQNYITSKIRLRVS